MNYTYIGGTSITCDLSSIQKINNLVLQSVSGEWNPVLLNTDDFITTSDGTTYCSTEYYYLSTTILSTEFTFLSFTNDLMSSSKTIISMSNRLKDILGNSKYIVKLTGPRTILIKTNLSLSTIYTNADADSSKIVFENIVSITQNNNYVGSPFVLNGNSEMSIDQFGNCHFEITDLYGAVLDIKAPIYWTFIIIRDV
jgi:hypothetical protein